MYIVPILVLCPAAAAREMLQRRGMEGAAAAAGRAGCGPAWAGAGLGGTLGSPNPGESA